MDSLRTLIVGDVKTCDLARYGVPPNLEVFQVDTLMLNVATDEDLASLRETLRSRDVSKWKLNHCQYFVDTMDWTEEQFRRYVQEWKIWREEVSGFVYTFCMGIQARLVELGV